METMEEYMSSMRSLRSQMNEIEEEAAKRSVEEQKQRTAIDAIERDIQLVRSETKRLSKEAEEMARARGEVCIQIAEKQKDVSAMETESSILSQTLELLQQEMASTSEKLKEKRSYYAKVLKDLSAKLQGQQDWLKSYKQKVAADTSSVSRSPKHIDCSKGKLSNATLSIEANLENMGDETDKRYKDLVAQLETKKAMLEELMTKKSELSVQCNKSKKLLEQLKHRIGCVPPELKAMDLKALEDEHKALLADKTGETEYLQSVRDQIKQLKEISHVVKCQCGVEYKVELMC